MFLWLKTLYRKRAVTWPFIFYTIIWTLSNKNNFKFKPAIPLLVRILSYIIYTKLVLNYNKQKVLFL